MTDFNHNAPISPTTPTTQPAPTMPVTPTNADSSATDHPPAQPSKPLAIVLPLFGQHLIEASAGTGKTWTLTGIVLRLLIEAGYDCDQIIASTFTRSAAAEMRQRIRGRLQEMQNLLQACQVVLRDLSDDHRSQGEPVSFSESVSFGGQASEISIQDTDVSKAQGEVDNVKASHYQPFMVKLLAQITAQGLDEPWKDPINQYLIERLAKQEFGLQDSMMAGESKGIKLPETITLNFMLASKRTNTALTQIDRLFVGTLDSLCQKWLQEFSAETGYQPSIQISNHVENIALSMIHDQLRAFRATVSEHEPAVFELMYASNRLPTAKDFLPAVEKALNFYSTPIDDFVPVAFDLAPLNDLLKQLSTADSEALQAYTDAAFRLEQGMVKNAKIHSRFADGLTLQKQLAQQGMSGLMQLTTPQQEWLESVQLCVESGKGFKMHFEKQRDAFTAMPLIQLYARLHQARLALVQHMDDLNQYFHRFICQYVRERLPVVLEAQQMTTFSLQLARLNHALASPQGEALARYIRYQYPVALIDESQDINTEQALLIQRIYLPNASSDNSLSKNVLAKHKTPHQQPKRQFLLLVGDPKQAIYGFRGGDVSNYNRLKAQFPQKAEVLSENRRSAPAVITALNYWFGKPTPEAGASQANNPDKSVAGMADVAAADIEATDIERVESEQAYFLGEAIYYRHIQASRDKSDLYIGGKLASQDDLVINATSDTKNAVYLLNIESKQPVPTEETPTHDQTSKPQTPKPQTPMILDVDAVVTAQILALMDKHQPTGYPDTDGNIRPLRLSHIGVLADKNKQLDSLELALQAHNIPTSRGGRQSLFAGEMTQDLIVLMQAMLHPYDMTRLRRLLLSHFFGLSLPQVVSHYQQHDPLTSEDNGITTDSPALAYTSLTDIQQLITEAGKLWQKSGFLTAIQWLLNQEVVIDTLSANFWQRLAQYQHNNRQQSGERLLIDLRHLLDIISQLSQGVSHQMGEYQLLEWLEQQHDEQPKEEWSMQQRLPSDDAVQLMTIHNSKGLEFPIVFVVGLDKKITAHSQTYQLYLYADAMTQGLQNRRLSPVPYLRAEAGKSDDHYKAIENRNLFEEKLRLAYVALTRCRDRLYIVAQQADKNYPSTPLAHWLTDKTFSLPEHLTHVINQVDINSLSKYFNPNQRYQANEKSNTLPLDYPHWQANIKMTAFIGWTNTSFTALARHLHHDKLNVAIHQSDYQFEDTVEPTFDLNSLDIDITKTGETEIDLSDLSIPAFDSTFDSTFDSIDITANEALSITQAQRQSVRFSFERGANTGTFLHKILETLPSMALRELEPHKNSDNPIPEDDGLPPQLLKQWTPVIDRAITTHQIDPEYLSSHSEIAIAQTQPLSMGQSQEPAHPSEPDPHLSTKHIELATWLYAIIHTPLLAPTLVGLPPISLAHIHPKRKIAELSFDMSLKQDFNLAQINQLFNDAGMSLNLNTQGQGNSYWRYLKGEIDLIYQAGEQGSERFFIVDYKSNYLGNTFEHYHQTAMQQTMNEHGYWLQAGIYQVALHRYLGLRLPHYDIHRHLGGVEYVFLRGMSPQYPEQGRLVCEKLTPEFILALDNALGNASMDEKNTPKVGQ